MGKEDNSFTLKRTYKAPIQLVWEAITDKERLKEWYFDFGKEWNLAVGYKFEWSAGPPDGEKWLHRGEIFEVVKNKKLSHTWEYPGYSGSSVLTWELVKLDEYNTEIVLTHFFKIPFDPTVEALRKENFVEGWNQLLNTGLVEYLEKIK